MDKKIFKRIHIQNKDQNQTGKKQKFTSLSPSDTLLQNIAACSIFGENVRTIYGTRLKNKILIQHIEEQDKMSIGDNKKIPELVINNSALKILIEESKNQELKASNGPIFVIIFSAKLLERSVELLELGMKREDVIKFYKSSLEKALKILETLKYKNTNCKGGKKKHFEEKKVPNYDAFKQALDILKNTPDKSEMSNNDDPCVIEKQEEAASYNFMLNSPFSPNIDYAEEVKSFFENYTPKPGFRNSKMDPHFRTSSNLVTYSYFAVCDFPVTFLHYDDEIAGIAKKTTPGFATLKDIYQALIQLDDWFTCKILVTIGNKLDDFAKFFMKEKEIMHINCSSRFDLNRICKASGAIIEPSFLSRDEEKTLGLARTAYKDDVADTSIAVIRAMDQGHKRKNGAYRTVIVEDIHNDIDPSKIIIRDIELVPGGGASEIELAIHLLSFTDEPFDQRLAIRSFSDALKIFPKTLAEVTTENVDDIMAQLCAAHEAGKKNFGINTEVNKGENCIVDAAECGVFDLYETKIWGLICGVNAVVKILEQDDVNVN